MPEDVQAKAQAIVQQARQMIEEARRGSEALDDALRRQGLDPDKVLAFTEANLPADARRTLAEQLQLDADDVEREVAQARLRTQADEPPHPPRRPHTLI